MLLALLIVGCGLQATQLSDKFQGQALGDQWRAPDPADDFVRVEGGDFWLHGRAWHPFGVNYWPRYGAGMYADEYFSGWLVRRHCDPDLVEEDLRIAQGLGITAISVLPLGTKREDLPCVWDFLERCKAHGIHVNCFGFADPRKSDVDFCDTLIGVGGMRYEGAGPVKWFDAVVHSVQVDAGGKSSRPADDLLWGDIAVDVPAGQAATVRLALMNTGDAAWVPKGSGAVQLVDASTGKELAGMSADVPRFEIGAVAFPVADLPAAGAEMKLNVQLEAAQQCRVPAAYSGPVRAVGDVA